MLALLFGLLFPLGWLRRLTMRSCSLWGIPADPAGLFVFCLLSLIHAAHRFRYTLYNKLQIKHLDEVINLLCYGGAIALSFVAAWRLWHLA